MERFFGGNPALVLVRLAILSLIVGVVLAALGFSPLELIDSLQRLVQRIYDMGFTAIEKAARFFLLGAVIVFPVWIVMRVLKVRGRGGARSRLAQPRVAARPSRFRFCKEEAPRAKRLPLRGPSRRVRPD